MAPFDSEIQITLLDDSSTTLIDVSSPEGELYAGTCQALSPVVAGSDCDDSNPDANPGAAEFWYNDVDEDCDQSSDFDQDGDGDDSEDFEVETAMILIQPSLHWPQKTSQTALTTTATIRLMSDLSWSHWFPR